jgi:two-component system LytT family response regulator
MIRSIIVDDEKQSRSALIQELTLNCPEVTNVAEAGNIPEAIAVINQQKPDLLFLDIKLSDGLGFDILEQLDFKDFHVIFTTAYSEYALKALKLNALDYLLKPIDAAELKSAVAKLSLQTTKQKPFLKKPLPDQSVRISLQTSEGTYIVSLSDIIQCTSYGNYCFIHLIGKRKIIITKTMKELEQQLTPFGFERIHHSHMVNLNHVISYKHKDGGMVLLSDDSSLPISTRKKQNLLTYFETISLR